MDTNRAEEVILGEIEGLINEIADLFEELSQASFDNEEDYGRASRAVTEVSSLVCGAYGKPSRTGQGVGNRDQGQGRKILLPCSWSLKYGLPRNPFHALR